MDRMDKSQVRIVKTTEQESDAGYWRTRPPRERLEALESIRREYHLWKYGAEPGFQRVLRIVKQK
jgi:hypothetical protein